MSPVIPDFALGREGDDLPLPISGRGRFSSRAAFEGFNYRVRKLAAMWGGLCHGRGYID